MKLSAINQPVAAELAYRQAVELYEKLLVAFPINPHYQYMLWLGHYRLSLASAEADRPDEAIELLSRALPPFERPANASNDVAAYRTNLVNGYRNVGLALKTRGHLTAAESVLRQGLQFSRKLLDESPDSENYQMYVAQRWFDLAGVLAAGGKLAEAANAYQELVALASFNTKIQSFPAAALRQPENLNEAIAACQEALRLEPDNGGTHATLGVILGDGKQDYERAITSLNKAVELDPKQASHHFNLGQAWARSKKQDEAIASYQKAVELDPTYALAYLYLGNALRAEGNLDEAIPAFRRAIELEPKSLSAYYSLAYALEAQKDPGGAIAAYRQALEALGTDDAARQNLQIQLASKYESQGNMPEAIRLLELVRDQHRGTFGPKHASALSSMNNLAVAYWKNKQLDRSIPLFEVTVRLRRIHFPNDLETRTSIGNLAVNYRDAGRLKEAIPLLEEVLDWVRTQPAPVASQYAWVTRALAETYEHDQQFAKAEPLHREALQKAQDQFGISDPRTAGPLAMLGLNLLMQQNYADAEPLLRECLALREESEPDAWTLFNTKSMLGGCLLGEKKYAEAETLLLEGYEGMKQREAQIPPVGKIRLHETLDRLVQLYDDWGKPDESEHWLADFKKTIELDPNNAGLLVRYGILLEKKDNLDEACLAFRQAIDVSPQDATSYRKLAVSLLSLKRSNDGIDPLRKMAEQNPNPATASLILGSVLIDWQKPDEAAAAFRDAIRLQPDQRDGHLQLAAVLRQQRKYAEAETALREAIRLNPTWAQAHDILGWLLMGQSKFVEAEIEFRHVIRLNAAAVRGHDGLGWALQNQNKLAEAVVAHREALALNPNHGSPIRPRLRTDGTERSATRGRRRVSSIHRTRTQSSRGVLPSRGASAPAEQVGRGRRLLQANRRALSPQCRRLLPRGHHPAGKLPERSRKSGRGGGLL